MVRGLLLVVAAGCGSSPNTSAPLAAEASPPAVTASAAPTASAPLASAAPTASTAARQCGENDLDTVLFKREHVGVSTKPGDYIDKRVKAAVIACFEEVPRDRRSTSAVHAVTLEWPNSGFQGGPPSGFGRGFGAGGGGDYPPKVMDEAFTACVTKAIPKENVSSLDPDGSKIQAIKLTVLAYTRGAANRHLTGTIGPSGSGGFGRGQRPCQQPDREE